MITTTYSSIPEAVEDIVVLFENQPSVGEINDAGLSTRNSLFEKMFPIVSSVRCEQDGAVFGIGFTEKGGAVVEFCKSAAREIEIPDSFGGNPLVAIGPRAFSTCYSFERVSLPDTVVFIGDRSFMNTALRSFEPPRSLRFIDDNAFFRCAHLKSVHLRDGLLLIGARAFRESALERLRIPATVEHIGQDAFKDTPMCATGANRMLSIAPENVVLKLVDGVLYEIRPQGMRLLQALDEDIESYDGVEGVTEIAPRAFSGKKQLRSARIPEGVVSIGEAAFRGCPKLTHVDLPDSLEVIERQAFWNTSLESVRIPASLTALGAAALYTGDTIAQSFSPSIRHVEVSEENTLFFMENDILCRRLQDGGAIALLYTGPGEHIVVPKCVTAIGPYAFLNAGRVKQLDLHDKMKSIDVGGLEFGRGVSVIVYDCVDDKGNPERHVIKYPPGVPGRRATQHALCRSAFDLKLAFWAGDKAIMTTQDVFIRSKAMLERLRNQDMLEQATAELLWKKLRRGLNDVVVEFGRNGFVIGIDWLYEQGILDQENIVSAIEAASIAGEVAVVSRLMELRRTEFAAPLFDFDL